MKESLQTVLKEIEGVLSRVDDEQVTALTEAVAGAPRTFVTGEGRSGFMARAFAMRLAHLGLTAWVVGETTTPAISSGDLLVAVSGSGTTAGTVHVARQAADKGAHVAAVTTDPDSPLGELAAPALVVPAATKWRREGEAATTQPLGSLFDQCCHLLLDVVCLELAEQRGMSNEAARARHSNVE